MKKKEEALKKAIAEADRDDDGFFINNNSTQKTKYFSDLNRMGSSGIKIKNTPSNNNNNNNAKSKAKSNAYTGGGGFIKPKRGQALGKKSNNNTSLKKLGSNNNTKKLEEIVGNMRYIYEIDSLGNKNLLRRLPLRNNLDKTKAKNTKNK